MVYVGGTKGFAGFGVQRCSSSVLCPDCLSNRDPYCEWTGSSCALSSLTTNRSNITAASKCPKGNRSFVFLIHALCLL